MRGPPSNTASCLFNLNDSVSPSAAWRRRAFRQAVSAAIDRDAIVRLVYEGYADPLASAARGGQQGVDRGRVSTAGPFDRARPGVVEGGRIQVEPRGALQDVDGKNVRFSITVTSSNPERSQMATLIQADLKPLGIQVDVVPLEFRSLVDRVTRTHDYEASIFAISSGDADPNAELALWLSSGSNHLWHLQQTKPATAWEAEIDSLMKQQLLTPRFDERKRLFDRVQEIAMENLPLIPLVSPHVLLGASKRLRNFRPAVMEPYALWNIDELSWEQPKRGGRQ